MGNSISRYLISLAFLVLLSACATQSMMPRTTVTPYFDTPPPGISKEEAKLFSRALYLQRNNKLRSSYKAWKEFLRNRSRSYEARNNIGLVLYADDQVDLAIREFEMAWSLEPNDLRIRKNLIRARKFRGLLLNENQDYHGAIFHYNRVAELSETGDREKALFQVEKLEDKIFAQVKRTNTLSAYEDFLRRYPDSHGNSKEARRRIRIIKRSQPQAVPLEVGVEGAMDPEPPVHGLIGTQSDTLPLLEERPIQ